jgi:peroxiredoxin family protein
MQDSAILDDHADFDPVPQMNPTADKKTLLLFSDNLDKVLATFVIANGAAAMDSQVTIFFAFWGINVLRKDMATVHSEKLIDRLFGWMMPRGPGKLKLSKMHMLGVGTSMMKRVMKAKNVKMVPELIATAREAGVRFVACSMSMDVMGFSHEELMDGVELGGVATFLGAAEESNMTLFVLSIQPPLLVCQPPSTPIP